MTKVLITGGCGFLGSGIVDAYTSIGVQCIVVDDLSSGNIANLNKNAAFYPVDIADRRDIARVFERERIDLVNHQAARVDVRASMDDPITYAIVNVVGTVNLLECCRRHHVDKIIYAQTGGCVYGIPQQIPMTEDHPIRPIDPYGASKAAVELYLRVYAHQFGLKYCVLRYPNCYGPRQNFNGEAGVVGIFARQMLQGLAPTINGTGEQTRDYVYVDDIVRANVLALDYGVNQAYNVGSGIPTSVNQVFAILKNITSYEGDAVYGPPRPGEVMDSCLDSLKAKMELGWKCQTGLAEGIAKTVEYVRERQQNEDTGD